MRNPRKTSRKKTYHSVHACMEALLGREDLRKIHQLGLWSVFASVEQVKRFAALPRQERQEFFARYGQSLEGRSCPAGPVDADHRLFDLPQRASEVQIRQRYRELALEFHPDRRGGDPSLMQEINAAYQRLLRAAGRSDELNHS